MLDPLSGIKELASVHGWSSDQIKEPLAVVVKQTLAKGDSLENSLLIAQLVASFVSQPELPQYLPPPLANAIKRLLPSLEDEFHRINRIARKRLAEHESSPPMPRAILKIMSREELILSGLAIGKSQDNDRDEFGSPDPVEVFQQLDKMDFSNCLDLKQSLDNFSLLLESLRELLELELAEACYLPIIQRQLSSGKTFEDIMNSPGGSHPMLAGDARRATAGSYVDGRRRKGGRRVMHNL